MTPWEFNRELDTSKSFQAFGFFLELGASRTLAGAYRRHKGCSQGAKRVPGFFQRWAAGAVLWSLFLQRSET